jgi:murein DD-endopeptidase MepM/ murein hydrolase activator NlpD
MQILRRRPHPIRVHGRVSAVVVLVLLVVFVSLTRPAGATGAPVAPVPVGVWPLQPQPVVVRAFEPPDLPFGRGHRGVDLLGTLGQRVGAALGGRVTFAGTLAGRGVVVVDHGSTRTTYEPVAATVHVGQFVLGGQQVGTLQLLGSHCFPRACLHWGWIRGDIYLDPLLLVGAGVIRLLPLWLPLPGPSWQPPTSPLGGLLARLGAHPRAPTAVLRDRGALVEPGPQDTVPHPRAMRPLLL